MKKLFALASILLFGLAATPAVAQTVNYRLDAGVTTNPTRAGLIVLPGGSNNYQALYTQNLLASLGGFNATNQHLILTAAGGSNTTATLNQSYGGEPLNYYAGHSLYVACHYSNGSCTGAAQGQTVQVLSSTTATTGASFTATGSGTNLTVSNVTGVIVPGAYVPSVTGIPNFTQILSQTSGTPGGAGVYVTTQPTTISAGAATTAGTGPVLTFASLPGGAVIGTNDSLYLTAPEISATNMIWQQKYNYGAPPPGAFTADTNPAHQTAAQGGLPGSDQSLAITLTSASDSATLQTNIDGTPNALNYAFVGNYLGNLDTNVLSGSGCVLNMIVYRASEIIINQNVTLSGTGWQSNGFASSAPLAETPSTAPYPVTIDYTISGCVGTILVKNPILQPSIHTNGSILQDSAIQLIKNLNVSGIRFGGGGDGTNGATFGCTTMQNLAVWKNRTACNPIPAYPLTEIQTGYSLDDEMKICLAAGVSVCAPDVQPTATAADIQCLTDYLGGGSGTPCGAIRIWLGQVAPWTSVFTAIPLEFGNEAWNTAFQGTSWNFTSGQTISSSTTNYFALVANFCSLMKASASWSPVISCAANVQENSVPTYKTTITNGNLIDYAAISGYQEAGSGAGLTPCNAGTFFDDQFAEAYENTVNSGTLQYAIAHSGLSTDTYESGVGFQATSCTGTTPLDFGTSVGAGLNATLNMAYLHASYSGVYNLWTVFQFTFPTRSLGTINGGTTTSAYGWGDYAGTNGQFVFPRPEVYAYSLFNACEQLGQINYPVVTNQITSNHAASNSVPAQANVPLMPGFVYRGSGANANQRCLIVTNGDRVGGSHPFTVSGAEAPTSGTTVTKTLYASGNTFSQDNEVQTGTAVVGPNVVTNLTNFTGDTLAPAQAASYVWTVGGTGGNPVTVIVGGATQSN